MRDLDRLKEVREYRVTGPQMASLLGLAGLLVAAAFVAGFEVGLWQRPVDEQLLEPAGFVDRDPGEVLAELLAERSREEVEGDGSAEVLERDEALARAEQGEPPQDESVTQSERLAALGEAALAEEESGFPPVIAAEPLTGAGVGLDAAAVAALPEDALSEPVAPEEEAGSRLVASDDTAAGRPEDAVASLSGAGGSPSVVTAIQSPPPVVSSEPSLPPLVGPPRSGPGFTVQVGAYEDRGEAADLIDTLRSKGFEAFHHEAKVGSKTWHRVRVGVYSDRAAAEEEGRRLKSVVPFSPFVTRQE